tara:strand:+ start:3269 stop:3811 length:543 start_codon:yes stop_codon:yes gene_type:complete
MSDLDELAEEGQKVPSTDLKDVKALAMKQLELEAVVAKREAELKEARAELDKIQLGQLPAALKAAGIPSFTLENGMVVGYAEDLKIAVPKARKEAIIAKMKEWGYEANVSNVLTVDLGKGGNNTGVVLMDKAKELGVAATLEADIASGTVKKALNARIREGKNDDLAFFGAFPFTKSTVK